ncbi:MAG: hypothetical protein H6943_06060 [Zoogloeaceae bacterium]|nr:hypothetical protein [Zoogloeaceae bacterium]
MALLFGVLSGHANAVEFGTLQLQSSLGQPLRAEIIVRAETGDLLTNHCIKAAASGGGSLPVHAVVAMQLQQRETSTVLVVESGQVLLEPASLLLLEANCGAGRVWQEFPLLPKPAGSASKVADSGAWVVAPGESPRSLARLLYPRQPAVQRRFIQRLAEANPLAGIEADDTKPLPTGSLLTMPDWRTLGSGAVSAASTPMPGRAKDHADQTLSVDKLSITQVHSSANSTVKVLGMRMSTVLQALPAADERLRDMLRLEYRLLGALNEQLGVILSGPSPLAAMQADSGANPVLAQASSLAQPLHQVQAPVVPATAPSDTTAPADKAAPLRIKALPAVASEPVAMGNEWLPFTILGLVLLLAVLWLRRRAVVRETPALAEMQTLVMEHVSATQSVASAAPPETKITEIPPSAPSVTVSVSPAVQVPPPPEASTDANPVLELAEIMLSFGRLEGAAQTLQEYIEANPTEALQPWMKLLDIYRMGGMSAEFEALASKLNRHFNVEVQHWEAVPELQASEEAQLQKAVTLEELPHLCEQVVATWGTPACLDYLHQLLRDNRGGKRSGFTLPVVQEILLLIDILVARESAGTS